MQKLHEPQVRSPGGRHGYSVQYSCPKNPTGRGSWQATVTGSQRARRSWAAAAAKSLCETPQTAAHLAPPSLGFSRQEHWSGLPFPSPMQESEKWKWSRSVLSDSSRPHGLQPTRLLHPWDFPGKRTGVGCHCLLQHNWAQWGIFTIWKCQLSCNSLLCWVSEWKSLSCVQIFATPQTIAHQAPPSMGFSRQEYWSGLPFPSPEDLPDTGIEPGSPAL